MIDTLRTELLAAQYAGLSDSAASAALNARTITVPRETRLTVIGLAKVLGNLAASRRVIESLRAAASSDVLVDEAIALMRANGGVDVADPLTRQMLDAFASNQNLPMTQEDADALKAAADEQISRAEQLGIGRVKPGHVQEARRLNAE